MVLEEGTPSLGRRLANPYHVLADAGLADVDAELEEFAMNARGTCDLSTRCSLMHDQKYRSSRVGVKVEIGCNDFQGADLSRRLLHRPRSKCCRVV